MQKSLRKLFLITSLIVYCQVIWSQNVGINTTTPHSSAALDIESNSSGILVPRMTSTERINILSPATGLLVFDNTTITFWYYDGTQWVELGKDKENPFDTLSGVVLPNLAVVDETNDDFVFGSTQLDHDGNSNHTKRFFFDKSKGAFRAGYVFGPFWNDAFIGSVSMAWGYNTRATANYSTAWGQATIASGRGATAGGFLTEATGSYATALGSGNIAPGHSEFAVGRYCTDYTPTSSTWDADDRAFVVGNGTGNGARSNAFAVYNNGDAKTWKVHYFGTRGSCFNGTNQGGSIELGPSNSGGGQTPFIDFHYGGGTAQDYNYRIINNANNTLTFTNSTIEVMTLKNKRVGIGTTNPSNGRLEVIGTVSHAFLSDYSYLTAGGTKRTYGNGIGDVSIYADGMIAGHRCVSHSDKRIKTNFKLSNQVADLQKLLAIRVTDYEFVDKIIHGNRTEKKVIAQELKEIYPQAVVDNITQVVPDIMKFALSKNGWVNLDNHRLNQGDTIRLVYQKGAAEFEVLETTRNSFKVTFEGEEKLLVYGRKVHDFHTVDYDAITMLNVSATQAQQKIIGKLQREVEALHKQNEALKREQDQADTYRITTENRLKKLENLLNQTARN